MTTARKARSMVKMPGLKSIDTKWYVAASLALTAIIFYLDCTLRHGYIVWLLYAFPFFLVYFSRNKKFLIYYSLLSSALNITGFFINPRPDFALSAALFDRALAIGVLWITTAVFNLIDALAEQRRREETLRATNDLARFPEENPNPVVRITREGALQYANNASATLLSCWSCSVNGRVPSHVYETVTECLATGNNRETEVRCGPVVYSLIFTPVAAAGYANIYGRDITERKRAQAELEQLKEYYKTLLQSAMQFFKQDYGDVFDFISRKIAQLSDGTIVIVNEFDPGNARTVVRAIAGDVASIDGMQKALGRDITGLSFPFVEEYREKMKTGNLTRVEGLHDLTFKHMPAELCRALEERFSIRDIYAIPFALEGDILGTVAIMTRETGPLKNGELIEAFVRQAAVTLQRRRAVTALEKANREIEDVLKRDNEMLERLVSERTRELLSAHAALAQAQRMADIGRLSSTIAHEMRNPLAAIRIAAYNVRRKAKDPSFEKHLETINKKVIEGDQIIRNLLNFTRIKSAVCEPIKLRELIRESIAAVSAKYVRWNVDLKQNLECAESDLIEADPIQMKMLFANLLDNAYQALPERTGKITVSVLERDCEAWEIKIKDTGTGIEKSQIGKIFEPFYTTRSKGTGLGLTVCKEIVELHQGSIGVSSAKETGTTFTVTLPSRQPPEQPSQSV